jgi:hypothetical protein
MFTLDRIVPWGRSFDEYQHMFALSDVDLRSRILGCADGPAAFNVEAFLYSDQLGEAFHVQAVYDLCRVAREVEFFRCSRSAADRHPLSKPSQQPVGGPAAPCRSRPSHTSSSAAAIR